MLVEAFFFPPTSDINSVDLWRPKYGVDSQTEQRTSRTNR